MEAELLFFLWSFHNGEQKRGKASIGCVWLSSLLPLSLCSLILIYLGNRKGTSWAIFDFLTFTLFGFLIGLSASWSYERKKGFLYSKYQVSSISSYWPSIIEMKFNKKGNIDELLELFVKGKNLMKKMTLYCYLLEKYKNH